MRQGDVDTLVKRAREEEKNIDGGVGGVDQMTVRSQPGRPPGTEWAASSAELTPV